MKKTVLLLIALMLFVPLTGCRHPGGKPGVRNAPAKASPLWIKGQYDRKGRWVPGHWR
mgnify:CR=1 FL=1